MYQHAHPAGSEALLGRLSLKDVDKFATLAGISGLFPKRTGQFLLERVDPQQRSTWLIKGHDYEDLRGQSAAFATLEQALLKHPPINCIYSSLRNTRKRYSLIESYSLRD